MLFKKISLLFLLLMFLSLFSGIVFSERYIDSSYVQVIAQEVSPEPVEPGQDFLVKVRVHNYGTEEANNVKINLDLNYPFYLKNTSESYIDFNQICSGCSAENTYYFTIDNSAVSGIYPIHFDISEMNNEIVSYRPQKIDILVLGKPDLILETTNIDKNISAGDTFDISFKLKNIGTGISRNIKVIPNSDKFMLIGSNAKWFDKLAPDKEKTFNIQFISNKDLIANSYKFPIDLEYLGEKQNSFNNSFSIGVNLLGKAELNLQNIKIDPLNPTIKDKLDFEGIIENTGTGEANNVFIELSISDEKTYKYFIGQLEKDDDAPFYFQKIKLNSIGNKNIILKINYDDDFGNYEKKKILNKEVKDPNSGLLLIIVIVSLFVLGSFFYFFKTKKNKKVKK